MEAIPLHQPLEVLPVQVALPVGINSRKGIVNIEGWPSSQFLLRDFDPLIDVEMSFEALEEKITSLLGEVGLLGYALVVEVARATITQLMRVVGVFWREGFAEI